jgi:hypothetical protein
VTATEEARVGDPVVTVTTNSSGTAVRWFHSAADAEFPGQAPLTATVRGVQVVGYLTGVNLGWVDAAVRAHHRLREHPDEDMTALATHAPRPGGPSNGPLLAKGG